MLQFTPALNAPVPLTVAVRLEVAAEAIVAGMALASMPVTLMPVPISEGRTCGRATLTTGADGLGGFIADATAGTLWVLGTQTEAGAGFAIDLEWVSCGDFYE